MTLLPKSRKARMRLLLLSIIAPVVTLAAGLALWGMRDSISFFYTPSQAAEAKPEPGQAIQLGGLVAMGSVVKHTDGRVEFTVQGVSVSCEPPGRAGLTHNPPVNPLGRNPTRRLGCGRGLGSLFRKQHQPESGRLAIRH